MDHALRTISYIADIGDLVVLMARRRYVALDVEDPNQLARAPKMVCHVFESEEAQFIAQSIGQAFQVRFPIITSVLKLSKKSRNKLVTKCQA